MAHCLKCGRDMGAGARWCPDCGAPCGRTVRCHANRDFADPLTPQQRQTRRIGTVLDAAINDPR
jgi:predicted amidophosphoribosyltransferase